ncbi:hypothetical protein Tco_0253973 [Tanacetum coccineum]
MVSSPKDKTKAVSTSRQPNKDVTLIKIENSFGVLVDLDVGQKVNEENVKNLTNEPIIANVDVGHLENKEASHNLSTYPKDIISVATSSVHAGDDSESDVENVYDKENFMASKHSKEGNRYGNKSLYEVWKEKLVNDDYNHIDDDEYNTHVGLSQ